ncbi:unnamed protein product, partial [Timema podura]|nr:unnamed protein product [Timema podura]
QFPVDEGSVAGPDDESEGVVNEIKIASAMRQNVVWLDKAVVMLRNELVLEKFLNDQRQILRKLDTLIYEFYYLVRTVAGATPLRRNNIPDRDSNLDLPVIGILVYCESCALDHVATEAVEQILISIFCERVNKDLVIISLVGHADKPVSLIAFGIGFQLRDVVIRLLKLCPVLFIGEESHEGRVRNNGQGISLCLGEGRVWQSDKSVPGVRIEPRTPSTEVRHLSPRPPGHHTRFTLTAYFKSSSNGQRSVLLASAYRAHAHLFEMVGSAVGLALPCRTSQTERMK